MSVKILASVLLITLAGATFYALHRVRQEAVNRLRVGQPMLRFQLRDVDGNQVSEGMFSGHSYGLLFFRTDCGYCQQEVKAMDQLLPRFGGQLPLLAVSLNSVEETRRTREEWHLAMKPYAAAGALARDLGVKSVPMLVLVGADGRVAYIQPGERSHAFQALVFGRFLRGDSLSEAALRTVTQQRANAAGADCVTQEERR